MAFASPSYVSGRLIRDVLAGLAVDLDAANALKAAVFANSVGAGDPNVVESYGSAPWNAGEVGPAGGQTLINVSLSTPGALATRKWKLDASGFSWSNQTFNARGVLVYLPGVSNRVLAAINFGADVPVVSGEFALSWDAVNGIFAATY